MLELAPQRAIAHSILALVYMEQGSFDEAWNEARIEDRGGLERSLRGDARWEAFLAMGLGPD